MRQLEGWLDLLPDEMQRRPAILIAQAYLQQWRHQIDVLPALLDEAAAGLETNAVDCAPDEQNGWQGAIACLRAFLAGMQGDQVRCLEQSEVALRLAPREWYFVRGLTELSQATALRLAGQPEDAIIFCRRRLAEASHPPNTRTLRLLLALCGCYYGNGNADEIISVAATYLQVAQQLQRSISIGWAHFARGWGHYQRNELDAAEADFRALVAPVMGYICVRSSTAIRGLP